MQHCEHIFRNYKDLKIHIGKMSKTLIFPRKDQSTSVSENPDLILTLLRQSSREEEEDNLYQLKQSDLDEYKMIT